MSFFEDIAKTVKGNFEELEFRAKDLFNFDDEEKREEAYLAEHHRFDSFAPVREGAQVKYFVDGKDYLWAVSEAIESARDMIFIEDWWLSPELYLRRPPTKYPEYRLDKLLKKKADEGVKIYVVVYKEVELALTLDSEHTKTWLEGLSKNIVVQRHPDHSAGGTFFWAHHEKFLIVDNRIAFLGGLDLCFGRWDTHTHRLADFHCNDPSFEVWPGQDYSNPRIADFKDVQHWDLQLIDKTTLARMPWHDISLAMLGGPHQKSMDRDEVPFLQPPLGGFGHAQKFQPPSDFSLFRKHVHNTRGIKGSCRAQILRSSADWSSNIETEHSIQNAYIESIRNAQHFIYIENQFFITSTSDTDKDFILKNQIGAAIVERIKRAHEENQAFRVIVVMPLIPAFPADLSSKDAGVARLVMHWQYVSICRGGRSILEELQKAGIDGQRYISFFALRSFDRINKEHIQNMLASAAGYSNEEVQAAGASQRPGERRAQFIKQGEPDFVRGTAGSVAHQHPIENFRDRLENAVEYTRVPDEEEGQKVLNDAIKMAKHNQARDSVGRDAMLDGNLDTESWVDDTLTDRPRGKEAEADESADYVTEELYIHAKLMIIDDRIVIMGSANLNDRSQLGDHDSEIAMIVEDQDMIQSRMNGEHWEAGRFAVTLRRQLWKEHLGLLPDEDITSVTPSMHMPPFANEDTLHSHEDRLVQDPLDEETYNELWLGTATKNTDAFREVFHCVPDEQVHNWDDYKQFFPDPTKVNSGHIADPNMSVEEVRSHLDKVRGHLVLFPLNFLDGVDLKGESLEALANDAIMELYT
ncbi:hypothetical protein INT44_008572 [Umbelopsis vinacea]|uniref:phospholipase D n=1 Tax=Umbelopsis vinacea TaxID=44442 RepID=A0A8H7PWU6_9FUNG|nr:hypothetical protein INT44_008572 [Umbelopsis vinacea]